MFVTDTCVFSQKSMQKKKKKKKTTEVQVQATTLTASLLNIYQTLFEALKDTLQQKFKTHPNKFHIKKQRINDKNKFVFVVL